MADDSFIETDLTGPDLLSNPLLNKGTAFTDPERDELALHGSLLPHVGSLEGQMERRLKALRALPTAPRRYVLLRGLQDSTRRSSTRCSAPNLEELLPVVYTPTVGEACERFSEVRPKPRGLRISWPDRDRSSQILAHPRPTKRGPRGERRRTHPGDR